MDWLWRWDLLLILLFLTGCERGRSPFFFFFSTSLHLYLQRCRINISNILPSLELVYELSPKQENVLLKFKTPDLDIFKLTFSALQFIATLSRKRVQLF